MSRITEEKRATRFRILNPAGAGIAGQDIVSFNINRNFIQNALNAGIGLDNVAGQSFIFSNTIDTVTSSGINPFIMTEIGAGIRVIPPRSWETIKKGFVPFSGRYRVLD